MRNVCFKTTTETACAPWGRLAAAFPLAGPPPKGEPRALGGCGMVSRLVQGQPAESWAFCWPVC